MEKKCERLQGVNTIIEARNLKGKKYKSSQLCLLEFGAKFVQNKLHNDVCANFVQKFCTRIAVERIFFSAISFAAILHKLCTNVIAQISLLKLCARFEKV